MVHERHSRQSRREQVAGSVLRGGDTLRVRQVSACTGADRGGREVVIASASGMFTCARCRHPVCSAGHDVGGEWEVKGLPARRFNTMTNVTLDDGVWAEYSWEGHTFKGGGLWQLAFCTNCGAELGVKLARLSAEVLKWHPEQHAGIGDGMIMVKSLARCPATKLSGMFSCARCQNHVGFAMHDVAGDWVVQGKPARRLKAMSNVTLDEGVWGQYLWEGQNFEAGALWQGAFCTSCGAELGVKLARLSWEVLARHPDHQEGMDDYVIVAKSIIYGDVAEQSGTFSCANCQNHVAFARHDVAGEWLAMGDKLARRFTCVSNVTLGDGAWGEYSVDGRSFKGGCLWQEAFCTPCGAHLGAKVARLAREVLERHPERNRGTGDFIIAAEGITYGDVAEQNGMFSCARCQNHVGFARDDVKGEWVLKGKPARRLVAMSNIALDDGVWGNYISTGQSFRNGCLWQTAFCSSCGTELGAKLAQLSAQVLDLHPDHHRGIGDYVIMAETILYGDISKQSGMFQCVNCRKYAFRTSKLPERPALGERSGVMADRRGLSQGG